MTTPEFSFETIAVLLEGMTEITLPSLLIEICARRCGFTRESLLPVIDEIEDIHPPTTRLIRYYLNGVDSEGVWSKFSAAWKLENVAGIPKTEFHSKLDARIAAFNRAAPLRIRTSGPAPRVEPEGAAHPLACWTVPVVPTSAPVQPVVAAPVAPTPPSPAERLDALGERLYPLVVAELQQFSGVRISAGKIVGMLLDAMKDDEEELNAIIGSKPFLHSYIEECIRTLAEDAGSFWGLPEPSPSTSAETPASSSIFFSGPTPAEAAQARRAAAARRAATKKAHPAPTALDTLAGSIMAAISARTGVILSHEALAALARETAQKALGLSMTLA